MTPVSLTVHSLSKFVLMAGLLWGVNPPLFPGAESDATVAHSLA